MDNRTDRDTEQQPLRKPDFDEMIRTLTGLSNVAQATFLARYAHVLTPSLCRTGIKYLGMRLDHINSQLPEDNPHRLKYEERKKRLMVDLETQGPPFDTKMPMRELPYKSLRPVPGIYLQSPIPEPWGTYGPYSPRSKDNPQGYEEHGTDGFAFNLKAIEKRVAELKIDLTTVPYPWVPAATLTPGWIIPDEQGHDITVERYVRTKGFTLYFRDIINQQTGVLSDYNRGEEMFDYNRTPDERLYERAWQWHLFAGKDPTKFPQTLQAFKEEPWIDNVERDIFMNWNAQEERIWANGHRKPEPGYFTSNQRVDKYGIPFPHLVDEMKDKAAAYARGTFDKPAKDRRAEYPLTPSEAFDEPEKL